MAGYHVAPVTPLSAMPWYQPLNPIVPPQWDCSVHVEKTLRYNTLMKFIFAAKLRAVNARR